LAQQIAKQQNDISKGLKQRIDAANRAADTAEEKVRIAYDYAVNTDGFKPKEAAIILYKRLKYTPQWIRRFIPDEAKNVEKSRHDQSHRKTSKSYVALQNLSKSLDLSLPPDTRKDKVIKLPAKESKLASIIIPATAIKNFYSDLQKISEKAEKHGLRIYSDATVEVLQFNNN
jgi:hypothetical protein